MIFGRPAYSTKAEVFPSKPPTTLISEKLPGKHGKNQKDLVSAP
jgi:hypothetical protein